MLDARELKKHYANGAEGTHAVNGVSLSGEGGEILVLHGPSGSGKSTLLLMLGGMLTPTSGEVVFEGVPLYGLSRVKRNQFRRRSVGFIFQNFHLMPYLTVHDNILSPLALRGERRGADEKIAAVAERLGIAHRLTHRPGQLSIGEAQRVAVARTLVANPALILADEPTGNLDKANREIIAECLLQERKRGRLVVLATHEERLMELGDRQVRMEAGRVAED